MVSSFYPNQVAVGSCAWIIDYRVETVLVEWQVNSGLLVQAVQHHMVGRHDAFAVVAAVGAVPLAVGCVVTGAVVPPGGAGGGRHR